VLPYSRIAEICVKNEIAMLQLREKHLTDKEIIKIARKLKSIVKGSVTNLIINDRPDIAVLCEADGLHLGQDDISYEDAIYLAKSICNKWNTSVLIIGGHFDEKIIREALVTDSNIHRFERKRKVFLYSHGTGCTLSTALACFLGQNLSLKNSYLNASEYLVNHYLLLQKNSLFNFWS